MAYTEEQKEEIFNKVIDYISNGMSLRAALKKKDTFSTTIWFDMIDESELRNKQYARACEKRADSIFDEILAIADSQEGDVVDIDGVMITQHNVIQRNRLQVDARKWTVSKLNPKKYGEKLELDNKHSGSVKTDLSHLTYEELKQLQKSDNKSSND